MFQTSFKPQTDPFELSKEIYENPHLYQGESQLELFNKISKISLKVFMIMCATAIIQHNYFPMNQTIEMGMTFATLIPLSIVAIMEEWKNFETLRLDVIKIS